MKMMLLAATAMLALGSATAFAGDSGDLPAPTIFTELQRMPQPLQPTLHRQAMSIQQATGDVTMYPLQSHSLGTWLFPPDQLGGGEN